MKTNLWKEGLLVLVLLIPAIYLLSVWNDLPSQVPMHYDVSGQVDRYGSKMELLAFSAGVPLGVYLLFLVIPMIDPKGKIKAMGNKFFQLKLVILIALSAISFYSIYSSLPGAEFKPSLLFVILGLLFAFLGNYFQSVRPNYFIGIRTPWTLENETVWRDTHRLGGRIWTVGGLIIAVTGLFIEPAQFLYFFTGIIAIMVLVPVIYSFTRFKALKKPN